jgi:hypothetical protein
VQTSLISEWLHPPSASRSGYRRESSTAQQADPGDALRRKGFGVTFTRSGVSPLDVPQGIGLRGSCPRASVRRPSAWKRALWRGEDVFPDALLLVLVDGGWRMATKARPSGDATRYAGPCSAVGWSHLARNAWSLRAADDFSPLPTRHRVGL